MAEEQEKTEVQTPEASAGGAVEDPVSSKVTEPPLPSDAEGLLEALEEAGKKRDQEIKRVLQFKRVQGLFARYAIPKYRPLSVEQIVVASINPVADKIGWKGNVRNAGFEWEYHSPGGATIRPDARIIMYHFDPAKIDQIVVGKWDTGTDGAEETDGKSPTLTISQLKSLLAEMELGEACDFIIFHVEGETAKELDMVLRDRSGINISADLIHQPSALSFGRSV